MADAVEGQVSRRAGHSRIPLALVLFQMEKRKAPSSPPSGAVIKRARGPSPPRNQIAISSAGEDSKGLVRTIQRTSGLEAPIVSLAGAHSVHARARICRR
ncbi:hypothetical protein EXIGLDRAFT_781796 [Exidia glandulosa HHB12029]|uniref:Uncharacterized protein n=1 Tax=Exidia glandulosa HHB12029 TaxID=1314781 RepID=A0A165Z6I2_EXIGL|nr:hypothetical protein EXIGLDRAFT_781796 [Exidia glandulosa HHB12029]